MKHRIKKYLQRFLGIENYLFIFSLFKIKTLKWDRVEGEFMQFLVLVPEKGVVLDIGANVGIMTALFAQNAQNRTVYAFEPMPLNFSALQRIVSWFKLKNVRAYQWALGNRETELEMVMPVVDSVRLQGLSHVIDSSISPESEQGETVKVSCKRLDDMLELLNPDNPVIAIKIDVQGFEQFVFDGARNLLKCHRPVVYCELGGGENRNRSFEIFRELDYEFKVWDGAELQNFDPQIHLTYWNFFLIPRNNTGDQ